jgi:hypothetical protein
MTALLLAHIVQVVAESFGWVEGPLWVSDALESREYLLFSDVKANRLWKWEEGSGLFTIGTSVLLERSGCRYALRLTTLLNKLLRESQHTGAVELSVECYCPCFASFLDCLFTLLMLKYVCMTRHQAVPISLSLYIYVSIERGIVACTVVLTQINCNAALQQARQTALRSADRAWQQWHS